MGDLSALRHKFIVTPSTCDLPGSRESSPEDSRRTSARSSGIPTPPAVALTEVDESEVYNSVTSRTDLGRFVLNIGVKKKEKVPETPQNNCSCSSYSGGQLASRLYAVVIVLVGVVLPVREALTRQWLTSYVVAAFIVYLYGASILFIIFLEVYLIREARKHDNTKHHPVEANQPPDIFYKNGKHYSNPAFTPDQDPETGPDQTEELGTLQKGHLISRSISEANNPIELYIIHPSSEQCNADSLKMPHHTSLYLRIGATVFGIGCMIYDGLLLKQLMDHNSPSSCKHDDSIWWPTIVHLIFLMAQTYFIFKHPQIQVTSFKAIVRFGFMHLFATNWCVWLRTLVRETLDSFLYHELQTHKYNQSTANSNDSSSNHQCDFGNDILQQASPYLFPCVLEYSLLAVATMYSMYADLDITGKPPSAVSKKDDDSQVDSTVPQDALDHPSHVIFTEINFHKSHKGLFLGVIVLAGTCVSVILFFSYLGYPYDKTKNYTSLLIYHISEIVLHCLIVIVSLTGWVDIRKLKFKLHGLTVDDVLLMTAAAGFLLFEMFRIQPFIGELSEGRHSFVTILTVAGSVLAMLTCIIHSGFLFDALCRHCTSRDDLKHKPGRGSVTFLLIGNLAVWVFKTFQMKQVAIENDVPVSMYGFLAWGLIAHACIPLLMFYHYHASACLAHVWGRGYHIIEKGDDKSTEKPPQIIALADSSGSGREVSIPSIYLRPRTPASRPITTLAEINENSADA